MNKANIEGLINLEIELAKSILELKEEHETTVLEKRENLLTNLELVISKKKGKK
ncbi:hypothetical protein ACUH7Y_25495 [Clostridium beijerinckii]|uniref:Uncharacterized protein n=1 Tax=Clostridium beijerinckii TaxID=1520 RepID=A0A7X9XR29_CLOBE|nr:hypothetical protein [Clostridium beijerinckii]NMF06586.1 hypothetical protein [Clostridium beijerinckii]